jgi:hypothetical protein
VIEPAILEAASASANADSVVETGTIPIKESAVHPGNILPTFLFTRGTVEGGGTDVKLGGGRGTLRPFTPDDSAPDYIWEGAMDDVRSPQLPYLTQDQWGCERNDTDLEVVTIESDSMKVFIAPTVGGKIWSAFDKVNQKEMFMNPKVHQPANIGALAAWAPGGSEWNYSPGIIGHSAFTESPTFLAKIQTEKGPMVRVYEYDRYNSTVWQVDILVDDDELWTRPRITNPTDADLRGYWWTCVAHTSTPNSRVISPADETMITSVGPLRSAPWPYYAETKNTSFSGLDDVWLQDHSYVGNIVWGDLFHHIPEDKRKYIMNVEAEDGYSVYHGHPLVGTKLFSWGESANGKFMQSFMHGTQLDPSDRGGDYIELQVGPAPTQMQTWPLPANSEMAWTEFYKTLMPSAAQRAALHDKDYQKALDATHDWIEGPQGVSVEKTETMDAFFKKWADYEVKEADIIHQGMPWGALNEKLRAKLNFPSRMSKGALFTMDKTNWEVRPWVELLDDGTFSAETLTRTPISFQVSEQWRHVIEDSVAKYGATWLHLLHLGIIATETGLKDPARNLFVQSMSLKATAVAARNIALLCGETDYDCAFSWYQKSWALAVSNRKEPNRDRLLKNLGAEISAFLQAVAPINHDFYGYMNEFISEVEKTDVPESLKHTDQYLTMLVSSHINNSQFDAALDILSSECFPTYGRARSELIDYWNNAQLLKKQEELKRDLTRGEQRDLRMTAMPPRNIGCPYASTYCLTYF